MLNIIIHRKMLPLSLTTVACTNIILNLTRFYLDIRPYSKCSIFYIRQVGYASIIWVLGPIFGHVLLNTWNMFL